MGLYVPFGGDYNFILSNISATRPGTTTLGTALTASSTINTMGTWTPLFTAGQITTDIYAVILCFHDAQNISNALRSMLVNIGVDNAGGSSYRVVIPYLLGGHATTYTLGGNGIYYTFPLYIPAGSSIAMQAQSPTASSVVYVNATVLGQPRRPDGVRVGTKVFQFGAQTATSLGTTITPGTTAEGAWTQLGTATTQRLWWWQVGYYPNDNTMSVQTLHVDVSAGNATTKKILLQDIAFTTTVAEQISNQSPTIGAVSAVASGDLIYGRAQSSATADSNTGLIAYGLGD